MRQHGNMFFNLSNFVRAHNFQSGKYFSEVLNREARGGNTAGITSLEMVDQQCSKLPHTWKGVISNFYKASFLAHQKGDHRTAFEHMYASAESFVNIFRECETNWLNSSAKTICLFVRIFGERAHFTRKRTRAELEQGIEDEIKRAVSICLRFKRETNHDAKRPVIIHVANQMFKIYFKMRNLNSTKQLIGTIENTVFGDERQGARYPFEKFTKSERVTWMYFSGVISMLENNFSKAEQNLAYALRHCLASSVKNKQRILERLIVVRMAMGRLPSFRLLQKYNLQGRYGDLVWAYRQGNLESFDQCLNKHYQAFFSQGTYLILHHSRIVVYRNFFKKAIKYYIMIQRGRKRWNSRIRFDVVNDVLNKMFPNLKQPVDETECVLSNLIFKGYLRGYLSHQKRMLVIKDFENAFPRIINQHEKR